MKSIKSDGVFSVGMLVKLTELGRKICPVDGRPLTKPTGIVTGFSRDGKSVWVRRKGHRTAQAYHKSFWDPTQNEE